MIGGETYHADDHRRFLEIGNVVTWRMPLYALVSAPQLNFEVDFSAGIFSDAKSQLVANN